MRRTLHFRLEWMGILLLLHKSQWTHKAFIVWVRGANILELLHLCPGRRTDSIHQEHCVGDARLDTPTNTRTIGGVQLVWTVALQGAENKRTACPGAASMLSGGSRPSGLWEATGWQCGWS